MNLLKTVLIVGLFFTYASKSIAQEKYVTYDNIYAEETFEIKISSDEKEKFTLYIDALSLDELNSKGGIFINQKNYQDFISALADAKSKYEEWVKTAKENNIKEFYKTMTVKSKAGAYFLYGNKWEFQLYVNLKFDFKIIETDGITKYLLLVRSGELTSSSNQFIKDDGFVLIFSSTEEIDNFIKSISIEKITDFLKKPKNSELFKD